MAYFSIAGEGVLDLVIARKALEYHGHSVFAEFDKRGKDRLDAALPGYLNASRYSPWLIFRDLDQHDCVVQLLDQIAPQRGDFPNAIIRICIRSVESWLLADRVGFARFFGVPAGRISPSPDLLANPKDALVRSVEASRHKNLRDGIMPRAGSGRKVGPEYNAVLSDYIDKVWSIERAINASESLSRAVRRIQAFA